MRGPAGGVLGAADFTATAMARTILDAAFSFLVFALTRFLAPTFFFAFFVFAFAFAFFLIAIRRSPGCTFKAEPTPDRPLYACGTIELPYNLFKQKKRRSEPSPQCFWHPVYRRRPN